MDYFIKFNMKLKQSVMNRKIEQLEEIQCSLNPNPDPPGPSPNPEQEEQEMEEESEGIGSGGRPD